MRSPRAGAAGVGVDTVKLVYDVRSYGHVLLDRGGEAWKRKEYGTVGPVWWQRREHPDGTVLTLKGCGKECYAIFEGSVPKYLGIVGPADPDDCRVVDRHLRRLVPVLPRAVVRRVDVTEDVYDPTGIYREAARGWNPHPRSRYTEAVYAGGETVWQHNKCRGVRVYDKFAESGESWAEGITRIEYQIRGDWVGRYGLASLTPEKFVAGCECALRPVVDMLEARVRDVGSREPEIGGSA